MTHTKPDVTLTPRYADAVAYASSLHANQARKSTTIPYISHLLGVSSLVLEAGGDEDMAIAGLLHDGPEDQGGKETLDHIRERFGDRVANIVEGCTDSLSEDPAEKPPWRERKEAYIAHLAEADDDTLIVSLADKLHNARAIVSDLLITGPQTWQRFNASSADILWYYSEIVDIAHQRQSNAFLVKNLDEAVREMFRMTPPAPGADFSEVNEYALSYNAYERWFDDLGTLSSMLEPLQVAFESDGRIPAGTGTDALRAWLFGLIRSARFNSSLELNSAGEFVEVEPHQDPVVQAILSVLRHRG